MAFSEFITARLRESPAAREVRSVRFLPFPQQIHRRAGEVALGHQCYLNPADAWPLLGSRRSEPRLLEELSQ